jgi:hypothetical protein
VAVAPEAVEREMLERGVLPDLLPPTGTVREEFLVQGARRVSLSAANAAAVLVAWRVSSAPAQWLPKLDAIALDCLGAEDQAARRWIRLAPRYLGRLAQGFRIASFSPQAMQAFISRVDEGMKTGVIAVEVKIETVG